MGVLSTMKLGRRVPCNPLNIYQVLLQLKGSSYCRSDDCQQMVYLPVG